METSEHMRPVCTRPIDLSAVRTLHKLGLSAGDIGRDGASGFLVRDRFQKAVACCTPACSAVTEVKLKMQLRSELPELIVQMVADNERMAISKNLALHKVAIPSEQPAMFCHNTRDHRLVIAKPGKQRTRRCHIFDNPHLGQQAQYRRRPLDLGRQ